MQERVGSERGRRASPVAQLPSRRCRCRCRCRASLVDGLQKLGPRYRAQRQRWVRDVLLGTRGYELTLLKGYMDDGGDYHTMYKLMYNDLQGAEQAAVLAHLRAEGQAVAAALRRAVADSGGGPGPPGVVLKILSDVDDTLFSSGLLPRRHRHALSQVSQGGGGGAGARIPDAATL